MIRVLIKHRGLSSAMRATFGGAVVADVPDDAERDDLVLTTTQDTSPGACLAMSVRGVHVVVLASQPRDSEEASYLRAGAANYIEMTANAEALAVAVTRQIRADDDCR